MIGKGLDRVPAACGKVIYGDNLFPPGHKRLAEMRPKEASAAGHQDPHTATLAAA
jgi:hypothetical protein